MIKYPKLLNKNFITVMLRLLYIFLFVFGIVTFFIQLLSSNNYFEVKTNTNEPEKMSGKTVFGCIDDTVYCFAYNTANINVFKTNGEFLYSSKIPKDPKENYATYISDQCFCIGTGINYEAEDAENTTLYKFNKLGFVDKIDYLELEPYGSSILKVGQYTYTSDWFGNIYLQMKDQEEIKLVASSVTTNYMNNAYYSMIIATIGFVLLLSGLFEKLDIRLNKNR